MSRRPLSPLPLSVLLLAFTGTAGAVPVCTLNGESVNPSHGGTTAGKTGLMRCLDGEGGPLLREEELRDGKGVGLRRWYQKGVLIKEHTVNEKGNVEGVAREYRVLESGRNQLVREETQRNGSSVGLTRTWYDNGTLQSLTYYGDDGREMAAARFTRKGQLGSLQCGPRALLGPDAKDAEWCGFGPAKPKVVELFDERGAVSQRLWIESGKLGWRESLDDEGKVRQREEVRADGGLERRFDANGTKRKEIQWITRTDDGRSRRITVLEQEHHESGTLVREKRWTPSPRGALLQSEQQWYLNGQPRDKVEYVAQDDRTTLRRESSFHDNGKLAYEGDWIVVGRYDSTPTGVHKRYDAQGRLRSERHHDARGRITREKEIDEQGRVSRDDEVFEDGSRKSTAR